ncbi:MAG: hypothetical protein HY744_13380 [Deltaproteobacteria bacterium]|nr:hypothetical protein [Deltaproteobacteria bacterium]
MSCAGLPVPADIVVYTSAEIERMAAEGRQLPRSIRWRWERGSVTAAACRQPQLLE